LHEYILCLQEIDVKTFVENKHKKIVTCWKTTLGIFSLLRTHFSCITGIVGIEWWKLTDGDYMLRVGEYFGAGVDGHVDLFCEVKGFDKGVMHALVINGLWEIEFHDDGSVQFVSPTGRKIYKGCSILYTLQDVSEFEQDYNAAIAHMQKHYQESVVKRILRDIAFRIQFRYHRTVRALQAAKDAYNDSYSGKPRKTGERFTDEEFYDDIPF
jgi:hypothetical protein